MSTPQARDIFGRITTAPAETEKSPSILAIILAMPIAVCFATFAASQPHGWQGFYLVVSSLALALGTYWSMAKGTDKIYKRAGIGLLVFSFVNVMVAASVGVEKERIGFYQSIWPFVFTLTAAALLTGINEEYPRVSTVLRRINVVLRGPVFAVLVLGGVHLLFAFWNREASVIPPIPAHAWVTTVILLTSAFWLVQIASSWQKPAAH
ncbi:MAG TPA: hypothetical protein VLF68_03980 [Candidatus Saccharimonadales bacterium]|nr:hypothetical protein [Candidatus Saccharimonadales bacterium]